MDFGANNLRRDSKLPSNFSLNGEMEQLSKIVHDRIGQAMVALKFMAETAVRTPHKDEQTLADMLILIQQTQVDVRNLYNRMLLISEKQGNAHHRIKGE
jgi:signal transduction histidine kinase